MSSRWCPTPEQLMVLEEMYRNGIRTPNSSQIQKITTHLSIYGKVEGKNVFYWFQNHKARDRLKMRRKLCKQLQEQELLFHNYQMQQYPLPHFSKWTFLPQVGVENTAAVDVGNYTWKLDSGAEKSMMGMYGDDWKMMRDVGPFLPSCSTSRPTLETLDLFPVKSSNHKEDSNADSTPNKL